DPVPLYLTGDSQANLTLSPDGALALRRRHALLRALDALPRALDRPERVAAFDRFHRRRGGRGAGAPAPAARCASAGGRRQARRARRLTCAGKTRGCAPATGTPTGGRAC